MAMTSQITVAKEYSKKPDIDAEADFAKHHRPRRPPKRLDENPETTAVLDVYLHVFMWQETCKKSFVHF